VTGRAAIALVAAGAVASLPLTASNATPTGQDAASALAADLDRVFDDPVLARAQLAVRVESMRDGRIVYSRDSGRHVIPASSMKIVTMAVAADRLGWDHRYETTLETAGVVENGTLTGDLVVVGGGDPSIGSQDEQASLTFLRWADALREAGIRRIDGRIIGDDNVFDDLSLGAGWSWDNLNAGYAAPSGALSYNQNVVVIRVTPGPDTGRPARVALTPPGDVFTLEADVTTGPAGSNPSVSIDRPLGGDRLTVRGRVPAGGRPVIRTTPVRNPTVYFVRALELALAERGITASGGAHDIDAVEDIEDPGTGRRVLARRVSPPLTVLGGYFMKVSQNFYGEMLLKSIGRAAFGAGTAENGRRAVRETLAAWGVAEDEIVMYDGSGLSRYNYATTDAITAILRRVWQDETRRGPFVALLPIGGRDGTLASRMQEPDLRGHVRAKTGTLNHVRALSGYLTTAAGETLAFSMVANHFTAPSAEVDAIMERALRRLRDRGQVLLSDLAFGSPPP
jgi:D-alanyl-D-alanine carboxypeptidase/D-alanyl-D-alanine-endopeptidase (penicillin-binding protein 4)